MQEIWKDIEGFDGFYQVSNLGNIKSFVKSNKHFGQESHLLKPTLNNSGYGTVTLYYGNKRSRFLVHKLVASAFIENPNNYPCVNHKDENKTNNCVDNLEWCTYSYNNAYGTARIRSIASKSKKVSQYTLDGFWLATYLSIGIAETLTGIKNHVIKDCCSGNTDTGAGYVWKYET